MEYVVTGATGFVGSHVAERGVSTPEGYESECLRRMGGTTWTGDNTKATGERDLEHRPIEEGLREYLGWELEQLGMEAEIREPVPYA